MLRHEITSNVDQVNWCSWDNEQATKGIRWMPWHLEAMKDVGNCDKLRVAVTQAVIRRFPNGKTRLIEDEALCAEYIGVTERTQGTETSKYLKE